MRPLWYQMRQDRVLTLGVRRVFCYKEELCVPPGSPATTHSLLFASCVGGVLVGLLIADALLVAGHLLCPRVDSHICHLVCTNG